MVVKQDIETQSPTTCHVVSSVKVLPSITIVDTPPEALKVLS